MDKRDIVVVAASEGGLAAVSGILGALPGNLAAAIYVVIHSHPKGPGLLAEILGHAARLPAAFAADLEPIRPGRIYVAPPDRHLVLWPGVMRLSDSPREHNVRPAADPLFRSAAATYGARVVGVVLTGGASDGASGARAIKARRGCLIVQRPEDARNPEMPRHAIARNPPDATGSLTEIPSLILGFCQGRTPTRA
jgi:two-component system chemotaxis response regulator CheB